MGLAFVEEWRYRHDCIDDHNPIFPELDHLGFFCYRVRHKRRVCFVTFSLRYTLSDLGSETIFLSQ